jgi:hypothetical protein
MCYLAPGRGWDSPDEHQIFIAHVPDTGEFLLNARVWQDGLELASRRAVTSEKRYPRSCDNLDAPSDGHFIFQYHSTHQCFKELYWLLLWDVPMTALLLVTWLNDTVDCVHGFGFSPVAVYIHGIHDDKDSAPASEPWWLSRTASPCHQKRESCNLPIDTLMNDYQTPRWCWDCRRGWNAGRYTAGIERCISILHNYVQSPLGKLPFNIY